MTEDQIRDAIRERAKPNVTAWANARNLSPSYVRDVISGARPPSRKILDAIGMEHIERVVIYEERRP
jgi:hypothetical protein